MEDQSKKSPKILNLIRKHSSLPTTERNLCNGQQPKNIFANNARLQRSDMICLQKKYDCVGLNEIKEHIKRTKRTNLLKKTNNGSLGLSLKSYTIKSNDVQQDLLLTKQQVLSFVKNNNINHPSLIQDKNKQSSSHRHKKYKNSFRRNRSLYFQQKLNEYQQKVQKLNMYTLHEKKQNIHSNQWTRILRTSIQLSDIYNNYQNNISIIKRNGIKVKARSKINKQFQWVQQHKQNSLFEFLDRKTMKLANLRMRDCVQ